MLPMKPIYISAMFLYFFAVQAEHRISARKITIPDYQPVFIKVYRRSKDGCRRRAEDPCLEPRTDCPGDRRQPYVEATDE
jgi:hypothetical protein